MWIHGKVELQLGDTLETKASKLHDDVDWQSW